MENFKQLYFHDIYIESKKGRKFVVVIEEDGKGAYVTTTRIYDSSVGRFGMEQPIAGATAQSGFQAAIVYVKGYLSENDPDDEIEAVYNPCNDPFIKEATQNAVLEREGLRLSVRVNRGNG